MRKRIRVTAQARPRWRRAGRLRQQGTDHTATTTLGSRSLGLGTYTTVIAVTAATFNSQRSTGPLFFKGREISVPCTFQASISTNTSLGWMTLLDATEDARSFKFDLRDAACLEIAINVRWKILSQAFAVEAGISNFLGTTLERSKSKWSMPTVHSRKKPLPYAKSHEIQ